MQELFVFFPILLLQLTTPSTENFSSHPRMADNNNHTVHLGQCPAKFLIRVDNFWKRIRLDQNFKEMRVFRTCCVNFLTFMSLSPRYSFPLVNLFNSTYCLRPGNVNRTLSNFSFLCDLVAHWRASKQISARFAFRAGYLQSIPTAS